MTSLVVQCVTQFTKYFYRSTLNLESQRGTLCSRTNQQAGLFPRWVVSFDREAANVDKGQVTIFVPFIFNFYGNAQFCIIIWFIVMWTVCKIIARNTLRVYFCYTAIRFCLFTSLHRRTTGSWTPQWHMHFYVAKFILLIFMINPLISLNSQ